MAVTERPPIETPAPAPRVIVPEREVLASVPQQARPPSDGAQVPLTGLTLAEEFGGARLLMSDIRTGFLLLDAVRHQVIVRLFGVSKDQEKLLSAIALWMLADAARVRVRKTLAIPGAPTMGDGMLGAGCARELFTGLAGPASRDTPLLGTLLMLAVAGHAARPAVTKSLHGARRGGGWLARDFHHRYGYLVDPGHWRERRARRRGLLA